MKTNLLFVCLGNICRSPSGEAIMKNIITKNNMQSKFFIDSAGTAAYHTGEKADSRMRKHGKNRGIELTSIARKFDPNSDFDKFDLILAMDKNNYHDLYDLAKTENEKNKIKLMCDYCIKYSHFEEVPDPYYGGYEGFELVLDILDDACTSLYKELISK